MNGIATIPQKENPTAVLQPAAGLSVNGVQIIALPVKTVAQLEAELAEVADQLGDQKRLATLRARAALAGIELAESANGFTLVGHRWCRHCGDLAAVARALGEIGGSV